MLDVLNVEKLLGLTGVESEQNLLTVKTGYAESALHGLM